MNKDNLNIEEILVLIKKYVKKSVRDKLKIKKENILQIIKNFKIPILDNNLRKYINSLDNKLAKITAKEIKPFNLNLQNYLQKRVIKFQNKMQNQLSDKIFYKLRKTALNITKEVTEGKKFQDALNENLVEIYENGLLNVKTGQGVVDVEAYTRMVADTELQHARVDIQKQRTKTYNYDLVTVQVQYDGCQICDQFDNMIISLNGESTQYDSLANIENQGFLHPNCRCELLTYLPDIEELAEPEFLFNEDRLKNAEDRDMQRYIERKIRDYKRKESLTEGNDSEKYKSKVSEWQSKMREFIKETGRVRQYERES